VCVADVVPFGPTKSDGQAVLSRSPPIPSSGSKSPPNHLGTVKLNARRGGACRGNDQSCK